VNAVTDDNSTDMSNEATLFERLINMAFSCLGEASPTVLSVSSSEEYVYQTPVIWDRRQDARWETLAITATELMASGPVLLVPPWERLSAGPEVSDKAGGTGNRNIYEAVLKSCIPHGPESLMAVLLPTSALTSTSPNAVSLREALAERWQTVVALYGAGVLPHVHHSFEVAALFLQGKPATNSLLKIFRVPRNSDAEVVEDDFQRLLARQGGRGENGYVVRDPLPAQESLAFDRHDPAVLSRRADLTGFGSIVKLGEFFTLVPSVHTRAMKDQPTKFYTNSAKSQDSVRLLGGRDLKRDGTIAPPDNETKWGYVSKGNQLQGGDLVLRNLYPHGDPGGLVVSELIAGDVPAAATERVIAIRPMASLDLQQRHFALAFLRSPLARTLVGAPGIQLNWSMLQDLPLPQPDEALTAALEELAAAKRRVDEWRTEADSLFQSVFLDKNAAEARARITQYGRTLRLRVEAASLLDDPGHIVRTRFPYPIAYRWREVDAELSADKGVRAYESVLATAEILLCYSAQLVIVLAREEGIKLNSTETIRKKLASGRSGPGFGDWVAVLEEVAGSRKLRGLRSEHPLNDLRTLLAEEAANEARQRLTKRRNDQAHLRKVDPIDLPEVVDESVADLAILMDRAKFLADWPLLHVTSARWDTLRRSTEIGVRELMGDHPVVPTKRTRVNESGLEEGSLYLQDQSHRLHLLRPFLVGRDCPKCRSWSTFHIDQVPGDTVILKSLEHGHTMRDPAFIDSLKSVELI
jgi:hypothetical protein